MRMSNIGWKKLRVQTILLKQSEVAKKVPKRPKTKMYVVKNFKSLKF